MGIFFSFFRSGVGWSEEAQMNMCTREVKVEEIEYPHSVGFLN